MTLAPLLRVSALLLFGLAVAVVKPGAAAAQVPPDTTDVNAILQRRNAELDSLLNPESIARDTSGLDRMLELLNRGEYDSIRAYEWDRQTGWEFSFRPLSYSTYNRVEGTRPGIGFGLADNRWFEADLGTGYGFANHRWTGFGRITLGEPFRPAVRLEAHDRILPFGPNRIEYAAGLMSLVAGQDRQDYLRSRGVGLTLLPWRKPNGEIRLSVFHREELPVRQETDYHFFGGGTPMEDPNPAIERGRTNGVSLAGTADLLTDRVSLVADAGVAGGELGGDFDFSWQSAGVTVRTVFPDGGIMSLGIEAAHAGGEPPVQALPFLGGDGNLRGYGRLEFAGTERASLRAEYATGIDLLARTGIKPLGKLRLQFIPFVDAGTTWGDAPGIGGVGGSLDGDLRSSLGLGIRREFWLPGIQAVRLDVIRRTDGSDDPWGFWFRILPLD